MPAAYFRDCQAWKDNNLPMSTTSNEAAKLYDSALTQMFTRQEDLAAGGIPMTFKKMIEADPEFTLGHALVVGSKVLGNQTSIRIDTDLHAQVDKLSEMASGKGVLDREKLHCKAVQEWADGKFIDACKSWEKITFEYPNDLIALKFQFLSSIYTGQSHMIRDSVGRVLQTFDKKDKFYGFLKSMQAFGLEETNMFELAECAAKEALDLNCHDVWGTHTLSHCYEMTGRADEGVKFLSTTVKDWSPDYTPGLFLGCHNYWHWALFYLELGDHEKALEVYDLQIGKSCKSNGSMLDIADAASLLQRLEFDGADVGNRWENIAEICRPHIDDHTTIFSDMHFLMAFLGAKQGSKNWAEGLLQSAESFHETGDDCLYLDLYGKMGKPMLNGLVAYKQGNFELAAELLAPYKYDYVYLGSSGAQRDVFRQLLIMSCIQSPNLQHKNMARAFLNEWKALKPNSPLIERMYSKLLLNHEIEKPH